MKNIGLKILSLVIAVALYFIVYGQSNRTELTLTLPIEFKNLPQDKIILIPTNRQAQVTIRGPSHQISAVATSSQVFSINLPSNISNNYEVPLSANYLKLAFSVQAININPSKFELVLDDLISKTVNVEIPTIGRLNSNYKLVSLLVEDKNVQIRGPSIEVNKVETIETLPLDLRNISESGTRDLGLRVSGSFTKPLQETVKVKYEILSISIDKNYKAVPIEIRSSLSDSLSLSKQFVEIDLVGPKIKLDNFTPQPYIRINDPIESERLIDVNLDLPEEVSIKSINPKKIKVKTN